MKFIFLTILLSSITILNAQSDKNWSLRTGVGFAPGFLTENTQTSQINAFVGFQREKLEIRVDGFYFLNAQGDRPRFKYNHQVYLGGFYKFLEESIHPYIGAQVGFAISESSEFGVLNTITGDLEFERGLNPLGSVIGGVEYNVNDKLSFFLETRYIFGKHLTNSYPTYLDEFRISIGLAFNLINRTTN